jgi:hypothetical protein
MYTINEVNLTKNAVFGGENKLAISVTRQFDFALGPGVKISRKESSSNFYTPRIQISHSKALKKLSSIWFLFYFFER